MILLWNEKYSLNEGTVYGWMAMATTTTLFGLDSVL